MYIEHTIKEVNLKEILQLPESRGSENSGSPTSTTTHEGQHLVQRTAERLARLLGKSYPTTPTTIPTVTASPEHTHTATAATPPQKGAAQGSTSAAKTPRRQSSAGDELTNGEDFEEYELIDVNDDNSDGDDDDDAAQEDCRQRVKVICEETPKNNKRASPLKATPSSERPRVRLLNGLRPEAATKFARRKERTPPPPPLLHIGDFLDDQPTTSSRSRPARPTFPPFRAPRSISPSPRRHQQVYLEAAAQLSGDDEDDQPDLIAEHSSPRLEYSQLVEDIRSWQETATRNFLHQTQMSMDIVNKLRQWFNFNTSQTQRNYTVQPEESRKRRSDCNPRPEHIKYRRVDNTFPKFVKTLDDDLEITGQYKVGCENRENRFQFAAPMSKAKMSQPNDAATLRKSIFSAPQSTRKIIKNTSYADVDYSDGDDVEMICTTAVPPCTTNGFGLSGRRPTYSEALRQNMPSIGGHVLGRRLPASMSSSAASTSASGQVASGRFLRPGPAAGAFLSNRRSIVAQEQESVERQKYQQLLEKMVPCIYGSQNSLNQSGLLNQRRPAANSTAAGQQLVQNGSLRLMNGNLSQLASIRKPFTVSLTDDEDGGVGGGGGELARKSSGDWSARRRRSGIQTNPAAASTARNTPIGGNNIKWVGAFLKDTVNLDDDQADEDDVQFAGVLKSTQRSFRRTPVVTTAIDVDAVDPDVTEIVDLSDSESAISSVGGKESSKSRKPKETKQALPYVEPVNTLQDKLNASPHLKDDWLESFRLKYDQKKSERQREVNETLKMVDQRVADRRNGEIQLQQRLQDLAILDPGLVVIDDFPEPEEEEEDEVKPLTEDQLKRVQVALHAPGHQVLATKFNMNIRREDIATLTHTNWLNDEVINYYMNLLIERSEKKAGQLPSVYAMNTFFVTRLLQSGHAGVKRWTRRVDIFAKDIIPVPVHVGGVHWCMAIIHMRNRSIKYYDSMGTPNPKLLEALEQYLRDESLDKRKQPFDTSDFQIESVADVPRQMNGSDCGVFSCMFAEYITRNRPITFSQQNMPYFRHKMILEIVQGEIIT